MQVADALPATMFIYSDGGFAAVPNFSLGNLDPKYVPIGGEVPDNLAVVAFTAERNAEKAGEAQAFARLQNSGAEDLEVEVSLFLNDELLDASRVSVPAESEAGVQFELDVVEDGVLRLQLNHQDDLSLDDRGHVALGVPRRARVLLVSPGHSDALRLAMTTDQAIKVADLTFAEPSILKTKSAPGSGGGRGL